MLLFFAIFRGQVYEGMLLCGLKWSKMGVKCRKMMSRLIALAVWKTKDTSVHKKFIKNLGVKFEKSVEYRVRAENAFSKPYNFWDANVL